MEFIEVFVLKAILMGTLNSLEQCFLDYWLWVGWFLGNYAVFTKDVVPVSCQHWRGEGNRQVQRGVQTNHSVSASGLSMGTLTGMSILNSIVDLGKGIQEGVVGNARKQYDTVLVV